MIAILSDIHGNLESLRAVIKDLTDQRINVSKFIFLGDFIDYGADSPAVIDYVSQLRRGMGYDNVICLAGNHDVAVFDKSVIPAKSDRGVSSFNITLSEISDRISVNRLYNLITDKYGLIVNHYHDKDNDVFAYHGTREDCYWGKVDSRNFLRSNKCSRLPGYTVILGGHSHLQGSKLDPKSKILYINPGSVGQPRNRDPRAQYAVCDDKYCFFDFKAVSYDNTETINKIIKSGRHEYYSKRLIKGV